MGPIADDQILAARDPAGHQLIDLAQQALRIDDDAAGDDAQDARRENAAGDKRKLVSLPRRDDRMPGIRPALIADDHVMLLGRADRRVFLLPRLPTANR